MNGRKWSQDDISLLEKLIKDGVDYSDVARTLKRSHQAITLKACKLGIKKPFCWKEIEIKRLKELAQDGFTHNEIANLMYKTINSVKYVCAKKNIKTKHALLSEEQHKLRKIGYKKCTSCSKIVPKDSRDFKKHSNLCKKCNNDIQHNAYFSSMEKVIHARYIHLMNRCKNSNLKCNIAENDILDIYKKQNGKCYYTGIDLLYCKNSDMTISIDRINPLLGYNKENVVLCGWIINSMKLDQEINQFIKYCKIIAERFDNA